jgi:hypothetical protein
LKRTKSFLPTNLYVSQADNEEQQKNWNSDMTQAIEKFKGMADKNGTLNYKHTFLKAKPTVQFPILGIMKL